MSEMKMDIKIYNPAYDEKVDIARVDNILYLKLTKQFSHMGGTLSFIYGSVSVICSILLYRGWVNFISASVFEQSNITPQKVSDLKMKISYKGLFNLFKQVNDNSSHVNSRMESINSTLEMTKQ